MLKQLSDLAWRLRHPTARRCPCCKMTWESRRHMTQRGGVCHDCADHLAERGRYV